MFFTLADVILIALILVFVMIGFVMGLIGAIGALVGLVAGIWVANNFYLPVADWLAPHILGNVGLAKSIAFIAIFLIVNRLVALVFWLVNKIFDIISIIPFLKTINRVGGMFLGLVEGVLILGTGIYAIAKFAGSTEWLITALNASRVAHFLVLATQIFTNLLP